MKKKIKKIKKLNKNQKYHFDFYAVEEKKRARLKPEEEILFVILTRLYNFDLHFEYVVFEIEANSRKKDRKSFL